MRWNRWVGVAAAVSVIAACNDHAHAMQHFAELACKVSPDDSVMAAAVRGYIKQTGEAKRFVYVPATDSSPPDAIIETLKHIGPTYMYSTIPAQQAVVFKQLESVGDYGTLVLAYHGMKRPDPLHPVITLSSYMLTGEDSGSVYPPRALALTCDTTGWVVPVPPKDTTRDTGKVIITRHARLRPQ